MSKLSNAVRTVLHRAGVAGPARSRTVGGSGAPSLPASILSVRRLVALAAVTVPFVLLAAFATALDAAEVQGPPTIGEPIRVSGSFVAPIDATRAPVQDSVSPHASTAEWRFEYATSESGPWTLASSGTVSPGAEGASSTLEHLVPMTSYYVRLVAKNVHGEATETSLLLPGEHGEPEIAQQFTTPAPGPPELLQSKSECVLEEGRTFENHSVGGQVSHTPGEHICGNAGATVAELGSIFTLMVLRPRIARSTHPANS